MSNLVLHQSLAQDRQFLLALAAAPLTLMLLTWLLPAWRNGIAPSVPLALSMVLWQPLLEELLFRGAIQGQLRLAGWGRRSLAGVSVANCLTTLFFALAHLAYHTPLWALSVVAPSLVFGYFRERHGRVYPAILLHGFYNGCYLLMGAGGGG